MSNVTRLARFVAPAWVALSVVGAVALLWVLINPEGRGTDAYSYWYWDPQDPYREAFGNVDASHALRYAPPFALAVLPLHALAFGPFLWVWTALLLVALAWQARWWSLAALAFYPALLEVSVGNIHILMAAAIVIGFRFPEAWAFLILTKVTPGVGLLWFAVRREWMSLARALAFTTVLIAVTWLVVPSWWTDWIAMLAGNVGQAGNVSVQIPLLVRLPAAVLIVAWGARTNRRWTVAVGALVSLPTIWPQSAAVLVALLPSSGLSHVRPRLRSAQTAPVLP